MAWVTKCRNFTNAQQVATACGANVPRQSTTKECLSWRKAAAFALCYTFAAKTLPLPCVAATVDATVAAKPLPLLCVAATVAAQALLCLMLPLPSRLRHFVILCPVYFH